MKRKDKITLSESFQKKYLRFPEKPKKKLLLIFVGIPGSGKTTAAKCLEKEGLVRVSTDEIKKYLISLDKKFSIKDLFYIQNLIFQKLIRKGIGIISDSNSDKTIYRIKLINLARKHKYKYKIVYLRVSKDNSLRRIVNRNKSEDKKKVSKWIDGFIMEMQIPREKIIINADLEIKEFLSSIKASVFSSKDRF